MKEMPPREAFKGEVAWATFSVGCLIGLIAGVGLVGVVAWLAQHVHWQ